MHDPNHDAALRPERDPPIDWLSPEMDYGCDYDEDEPRGVAMNGITRERLAAIEAGLVNHQLPPTPEMQDMAAALRRVWDVVEVWRAEDELDHMSFGCLLAEIAEALEGKP